jgi:hypothetical protein
MSEIQQRYIYPSGLGETVFPVPHLLFVDVPTVIADLVSERFNSTLDISELTDPAKPDQSPTYTIPISIPDTLLAFMH